MVKSASGRVQRKYRATQQPAQVWFDFTVSLIVFCWSLKKIMTESFIQFYKYAKMMRTGLIVNMELEW